ncbi:MAG TPA: TAT-dependent nitrous-oxide reductase, partial [Candidatus Competibacteraceae bacterium]|nr:TAT-dependent nitrous-oxide reductase [Candidatus Competibacteraceae bacterium]
MSDTEQKSPNPENPENTGRRKFLGAAALTGLAGAGLATGLAALDPVQAKEEEEDESREHGKFEVPPGQLDDYYIFSSGGHSGE